MTWRAPPGTFSLATQGWKDWGEARMGKDAQEAEDKPANHYVGLKVYQHTQRRKREMLGKGQREWVFEGYSREGRPWREAAGNQDSSQSGHSVSKRGRASPHS